MGGMGRTGDRRYVRRGQQGITLLELLVVLGIIAAVAGIGVQVYNGVSEDAEDALVRSEMRQVASAIQRFRNDTGFFPKQGPFDSTDSNDGNITEPANLAQLFVQPQDGADDAILPFDTASGTGWNGPYVTELDAIQVNIGTDLAADGLGDPTAGTEVTVRGIGDPFEAAPVGTVYAWVNSANAQIAQLGRPFFYFIDGGAVTGCTAPCLLSAGPDGVYAAGAGDDIVINIGLAN